MKILQIHRHFNIKGGAERYFFELSRMLESHGHKIAFFSMHDKDNIKTKWNKYFVSNLLINNKSILNSLRLWARMTYSLEAKKKISKLLDEFKPDIVHIHNLNIFISPSILTEIKRRKIPIIQTLHDYYLIAPTRGSLFHGDSICEFTKKDKYYKAVLHRCIGNSYFASLLFVLSYYFHYILRFYDLIDLHLAPSNFLRNKYIEYGFNPKKIIYLPYFIDTEKYKDYSSIIGKYILYFGRLSPEKGLPTLIHSMEKLPHINLIISGDGIQLKDLMKQTTDRHLQNIKFVGFKEGEELRRLIYHSRFTVVPSIWYENMPNSILESFASGKPVIASNIGGIPEIVKEGYNSFLFEPKNIDDYKQKIEKLWNNSNRCQRFGRNARDYVKNKFSPEEHYTRLFNIYKKLTK